MSTGNSAASDSGQQIELRGEVSAPPQPPPRTSNFSGSSDNIIEFRHPGYPDEFGQNVLLTLYAFDGRTSALHHATARLACAIVACNAWTGYLILARGGERLALADDDLLTAQIYYFYVPDQDRYPVYPNFDNWTFPHDNLPPYWTSAVPQTRSTPRAFPAPSNVTQLVLDREHGCLITKYEDCVDKAHICPQAEVGWFRRNMMQRHNLNKRLIGDQVINDLSNVTALRMDLHRAFDSKKLVLVPKMKEWVVHFIDVTSHLGQLYHNTTIKLHPDISPEHLLARFAWAIFPSALNFLLTPNPGREIRVRTIDQSTMGEKTRLISPGEAEKEFNRPPSPKKRKAGDSPEKQENSNAQTPTAYKRARIVSPPSSSSSSGPDSQKLARLHTPPDSQDQPHLQPSIEMIDGLAVDRSASPGETHISPNPYAALEEERVEWEKYDNLRLEWIRKRRPSDPSLYCCDYNTAETGGGGDELCTRCLGVEYTEDREEDLPGVRNKESNIPLSLG
ncbi:hypothetical protein BJ546DRAFT_1013128 [Cryomyces antarcticus]|uniref:HNH nuclease domain-containing protein n=1 Tax=Cryomyces antarcticus TaxID=329879 RepID=A0ABR0KT73_9PEZI|nr:hypothetical protein LTR39_001820 [Cryomyces antarcticus]KAK5017888.1 hypothetical protein LTR60_001736 [Cryomyces antarcticus]KAK5128190.1 hypothetical protein LTR16_002613 [Cryomyces antarcticus]KAK5139920.1 hypothetical protein LTR04_003265 [Oleoguttula sp. CCFEE 6159]